MEINYSSFLLSYFQAFSFLLGLCIGSFLNVVIYRLPLKKSIVSPRSRCPECTYSIPWYFNIPLLSFLFLMGKCYKCKTSISYRYPIVELLTGVGFFLVSYYHENIFYWPFGFFFISALISSSFIDLDHWIIPDKITYPGMFIGIISSFFTPGFENLVPSFIGSLAGLLFGGGILYFIAWLYLKLTGNDGLGGGDIKLLAMVGAFLGIQGAVITLIISSIVGSILGIFLIFIKGKAGKSAIPFGPFISLGAIGAFFWGPILWQWYIKGWQ
ncbi:MAG: prepilin peptidase [Oligoflexia bacterium]|nr:prepilin peptidase [Oligoflexia bacterium]